MSSFKDVNLIPLVSTLCVDPPSLGLMFSLSHFLCPNPLFIPWTYFLKGQKVSALDFAGRVYIGTNRFCSDSMKTARGDSEGRSVAEPNTPSSTPTGGGQPGAGVMYSTFHSQPTIYASVSCLRSFRRSKRYEHMNKNSK